MDTTPVSTLKVGDVILDGEGLELRVTGYERTGRLVVLTVEYVEAGMMAACPTPTTLRLSMNRMVRLA